MGNRVSDLPARLGEPQRGSALAGEALVGITV